MKEYVRNFYKNLYKRPTVDSDFNENCIREFLGEDIVNSRLVQDSIIPAQLSLEFESPLTLHELDISAGEGNRSVSGMEGLSNCFIKRFWEFLRIPLYRYATACHVKGSLTQNFSTASIKLIPKKGDATKIKNWRPISLLSCLYKVISRALNNRLKKATGYIFSRSQKGFTSDRHIQEVLINVVEMISHCKSNGISGAILSIDQAKAFDSISHKYMREVYKFFGFGPNFTKLLETLETIGQRVLPLMTVLIRPLLPWSVVELKATHHPPLSTIWDSKFCCSKLNSALKSKAFSNIILFPDRCKH